MRNVLISTLAMGAALAFSTPAFAQGQCVWADGTDNFAATGDGNLTYGEAVRRAMASQPGRAALAAAPAACPNVEAETLRQEGVTGTDRIPNGGTFAFGLRLPRLAAAPAQPATLQPPAAPANAGTAGPGATIDGQIADLYRQIAELRAAGGNPAAIAALQADIATLRAERAQASQPVVRNTTVVRRETRVVNQGLNAEQRTELGLWTSARKGITDTFQRLFGTGEDDPKTPAREDGIIGGLQAADAESDRRHDATEATLTSWWTPQWWWFLVALGAFLAWRFFRKESATKDDLTTKADATTVADLSQRVDEIDARLTDTEQQVGKKTVALAPDLAATVAGMKEGEELTTPVVVESVAHEVGLRKGAGQDVFIVSGVKGHTASNAVKAYNLASTLRNAAWSDRLNVKASV